MHHRVSPCLVAKGLADLPLPLPFASTHFRPSAETQKKTGEQRKQTAERLAQPVRSMAHSLNQTVTHLGSTLRRETCWVYRVVYIRQVNRRAKIYCEMLNLIISQHVQ